MKNFFLTLAFAAVTCVSAQAASISVAEKDSGDNVIYSLTLNGISAADQVTAISVSLLPGSSQFLNYNSIGYDGTTQLVAGDNFSFTNAVLSLPATPPFFGKGWGVIDGSSASPAPSDASGIGYAASTPGAFLTADNLFLNNVVLPKSATGAFALVLGTDASGGSFELRADLGGTIIPEPSTMIMGGLSLIGLAFRRRNG